ncbi:MAG: hypothetical protein ACXWXS_01205 [Actinomycetota bacterium]
MRKLTRDRWKVGASLALFSLLTACGNEGDGNDDTLLTGFSALVILAIVIGVVVVVGRRRR